MNGVLVVDKPAGPTSHDVVARVRRALRTRRIGHTGTLDPLATGVLPLVVGRATRLAQFLTGGEKEYVAGVRLGQATPTYDAEPRMVRDQDGAVVLMAPPAAAVAVEERAVREALQEFTGTYPQMPPPFSAKKIGGTAAYVLARKRQPVEVRPVEVTVRRIELLGYADGLATIRIVSSSGFYVRSLAHDLGQRLGCGAHLESLRRTRSGSFTLAEAVPLAAIEEEGPEAAARLVPMSRLLPELPGVIVTEQGARRVAHGNALTPMDLLEGGNGCQTAPAGRFRVLDREGSLLAIGEARAGGILQPLVVVV